MEPYMFKFSEGIILNQEESLHLQLKLQVSEINVKARNNLIHFGLSLIAKSQIWSEQSTPIAVQGLNCSWTANKTIGSWTETPLCILSGPYKQEVNPVASVCHRWAILIGMNERHHLVYYLFKIYETHWRLDWVQSKTNVWPLLSTMAGLTLCRARGHKKANAAFCSTHCLYNMYSFLAQITLGSAGNPRCLHDVPLPTSII